MGSDIGIIIPSEFNDIRDKRKAEKYLRVIAKKIESTLKIEGITTRMNDDYCDGSPLKEEWPDFSPEIWVPTYEASIYLADGFWYMFNGYRYHQLFYPPGTQWLRYNIFDIVRALGQHEAWYCSVHDIEDSVGIENYTLESWLDKAKNSEDGIAEYDLNALKREGESLWDNQSRYYHDSFTDLYQKVEDIEEQEKVRVLGLTEFGEGKIRVMCPSNSIIELMNGKIQ